MIKFWKEDFKYVERYGYYNSKTGGEGLCYAFTVRGESANYLMNKYKLGYPNVSVYLYMDDNGISTGSKTDNKLKSDLIGVNDKEDTIELWSLLKEDIEIDQRNYEEYMCDDWYKRDSRWK